MRSIARILKEGAMHGTKIANIWVSHDALIDHVWQFRLEQDAYFCSSIVEKIYIWTDFIINLVLLLP